MQKERKEIKCVVWDLDNTIWDGVLMESDEVCLKDGVKEIIQELDARGILNSIASRNNEEDAMKKIMEFGLKEYFLYPEINWNPKSSSIKKIAQNLNIGINTFAFVDDQQFELDEVQESCEGILCIPAEEYQNILTLERMNPRFITEDSKRRRQLYLESYQRNKDETEFEGTPKSFLRSLNMKLYINKAKESDLMRAEELTLRTSQLNATGITYSYDELNKFRVSNDYDLYICELEDRYGSYGKIGIALIEKKTNWTLKLLLVSCRVMSRGIGTILLNYIMKETKKFCNKLYAEFVITNRNRQMLIAYKFANFNVVKKEEEKILFVNDLMNIQEVPDYFQVITD